MTVLKPIRYAENIQGLKKHIDNYVKLDYGTKAVLSYAEKLYDKIKQNELLGEQESEYIFGMAFVENIAGIRKRPEIKSNPEFAHHPVFRKLGPALDRLEKLKDNLKSRYDLVAKEKVADQKIITSKIDKEATQVGKTPEIVAQLLSKTTREITCKELMTLMRDGNEYLTKNNKIIFLVDIRSGADFLENRIQFDDRFARLCLKPKITHVEISIAKPGLTGTKLVSGSKSRDGYNNRLDAFVIVLFSTKSSSTDLHDQTNPIRIVFDALTKFDSPRCHSKVFVLSGGLNEWSSLYTHLMSNPKTTKPEFSQSSTIESALHAAGYQSAKEILEPKQKQKPAPIRPTSPIPVPSKPIPTEPVPMDTLVPVKDDEIANLKKERAELELQIAKIRKEEAEKEKLRRNGFLFLNIFNVVK